MKFLVELDGIEPTTSCCHSQEEGSFTVNATTYIRPTVAKNQQITTILLTGAAILT
jgi:hypothetical protein